MHIILLIAFVSISLVFSEEEPDTIVTVIPKVIFSNPLPKEDAGKTKIEKPKEPTDLYECILNREKKITANSYSYFVPNYKITWPSLMPREEKMFWRNILEKFAGYKMEVYPWKAEYATMVSSRDVVWFSFLHSIYPHMDLFLYLKECSKNFPIIVIFNDGNIIALDYRKFIKDKMEDIYFDGMGKMELFKQMILHSQVIKTPDKKFYGKLIDQLSEIIAMNKPMNSALNSAIQIYKTDIDFLRNKENLTPRSTFNDGQYLFIKNKKDMASFFILELYLENELPAIVCDLTYSLWNACVSPDKNTPSMIEDQKKLGKAIADLKK